MYFIITKFLNDKLGITEDILLKIILSLSIFIIFTIVRKIILVITHKNVKSVQISYKIQKATNYIVYSSAALIIGRVWFKAFQSLTTLLGLLSAGVAIALKDIVLSFAGWVVIIMKSTFTVGDRVEVGEFKGDVVDIRFLHFTIIEIGNWVDADQSTGRVVHIPNFVVFRDMIANYTAGFHYLWHEIPVLITFESDRKLAKVILETIINDHAKNQNYSPEKYVKEASKKYMIHYSKLTPKVYMTVKASGVLLTIRFLCKPRTRRDSEELIWDKILDEFDKYNAINLAYPTQRIVYNKPDLDFNQVDQNENEEIENKVNKV